MEGIKYYDIKNAPFKIYGIYYSEEDGHYRRIPQSVADSTNDGVRHLSKHTAGGRVRFKTNSEKLVLRVEGFDVGQMFHTTPLMQYGFDIYKLTDRGYKFLGATKPAFSDRTSYEIAFNLPKGDNELTVVFPLYGCVKSLEICIYDGASL